MWLARGAVVVCIGLLVVMQAMGGPGEIRVVQDGNATIYYGPPILIGVFCILAALACVMGIVFWMQPGRLFRVGSIVLFLTASYIVFNVPSLLSHRTIVTSDSFANRTGPWYSPVDVHVDLKDLRTLEIVEMLSPSAERQDYQLRFYLNPEGTFVEVPFNDVIKKAVPTLLRNLEGRDVTLGNNLEAWQYLHESK